MRKEILIPENAIDVIDAAGDAVGAAIKQEIYELIRRHEITSPIEQMFMAAIHSACRQANWEIFTGESHAYRQDQGIYVLPQHKVGSYKIDFLVKQLYLGPSHQPIAVELDGHAFHDRTKEQRTYEKKRDRFLASLDYKVAHYTGSEIYADPFVAAEEVLQLVTDPKDLSRALRASA